MNTPQFDATTPLSDLSESDQPTFHGLPKVEADALAPGTVIAGRFRVVALLGLGGMGAVYRADDLRLGQPVALKFVAGSGRHDRLYHEVRMSRRVSHPNVCRVHDVVEADGHRFIAMEYVDGEDLATLLRRIGRLSPAKALDIARDLCAALIAAHDQGIIHRDLKPANVMIDGNGRAHVTDFGLASEKGDHLIAGTPAYMAPEQLEAGPLTPRTDLYAFGLILYETFTGKRVYNTPSLAARATVGPAQVEPPSTIAPDIDPALERLILRCLEAQPELRPPSARSIMAELPGGDPLQAAVAAGETPSPEMVAAAAKSGKLRPVVAAAWLGAAVAGAIAAVFAAEARFFQVARKPPEVLVDRAQEVIRRAGVAPLEDDRAWAFDYDSRLLRTRLTAGQRWKWSDIADARPGVIRFLYRGAPFPLAPRELASSNSVLFLFESGKVQLHDPPLEQDGMTAVVLDQHGALVELRAKPAVGPPKAVDWRPLIEATGVDMMSLRATQPKTPPPVASESRTAWTARYREQPNVEVRIETASLHGKPAWLAVVPPWAGETPRRIVTGPRGTAGAVQFFLSMGSLVVAAFLAKRNRRHGRGDPQGTARLSAFVLACMFFFWLLTAHHTLSINDEARIFSAGLSQAIATAALLWLFYTALEPEVRRRWPEWQIGWARMLAGRLRDPLVGRDVLIGIVAGCAFCAAIWIGSFTQFWFARGRSGFYVRAQSLDPLARFLGNVFLAAVEAASIAIGAVFLLLILRVIFRREWVANALWLIVFGLAAGAGTRSIGMSIVVVLMLVLVRYAGILALAVGLFVSSLLQMSALTFDTEAWFWPRSAAIILALIACAAWAAWTAIGRKPLLRSLSFDAS